VIKNEIYGSKERIRKANSAFDDGNTPDCNNAVAVVSHAWLAFHCDIHSMDRDYVLLRHRLLVRAQGKNSI